jgi:hypothetical protein
MVAGVEELNRHGRVQKLKAIGRFRKFRRR